MSRDLTRIRQLRTEFSALARRLEAAATPAARAEIDAAMNRVAAELGVLTRRHAADVSSFV